MMSGVGQRDAPGGRTCRTSLPSLASERRIKLASTCVPVECIYEAEDQFYIHPEECIDCGACIPACPVEAIFPEEDVPAEWESYIKKNYELSGL